MAAHVLKAENTSNIFDRCSLKDRRQRKSCPQPALNQGEQTYSQERVSPQLKKIVGHPDGVNIKNLLPDERELAFQVVAGPDKHFLLRRPGSVRRRQCPTVHLSVGCHRHGLDQHNRRRHEGFRQPVPEVAPQVISRCVRHHIGHQPLIVWPGFPGQDNGFTHGRELAKHGLDFSRFDSNSADLNLVVGATEELDVAVGAIARQIAGLVHSRSRLSAEGVRSELLGG